MPTESWPVRHFSQANPAGEGQDHVPTLLRRVAESIEELADVEVQDITFHAELTADAPWHSTTVYFDAADDAAEIPRSGIPDGAGPCQAVAETSWGTSPPDALRRRVSGRAPATMPGSRLADRPPAGLGLDAGEKRRGMAMTTAQFVTCTSWSISGLGSLTMVSPSWRGRRGARPPGIPPPSHPEHGGFRPRPNGLKQFVGFAK